MGLQRKSKLLYLLDYLKKHSDEQHPVQAAEIMQMLADNGISVDRKTVYDDILLLKDYGFDIEALKYPKRGYAMLSREFEPAEIYLLTDAVRFARFITPKKTDELIRKLEGMLSVHQKKDMNYRAYGEYGVKCKNEELYYNIENICNAIFAKKKISFDYIKKVLESASLGDRIKSFVISPYAIIWDNDHYYLIGNNEKYDNLMTMRIDRMKRVKITEENWRHFSQVSRYTDRFDAADYAKKSLSMFGGEAGEIVLECDNNLLDWVIDRFGEDTYMRDCGNGRFVFSTTANVSDGLVAWVLQFGDGICVKSPLELKNMVIEKVRAIEKMYIG